MPAVLNSLEQRILDYMVRYLRTHTYQPSIREIGEEFGIRSTKTVSEHLKALAEKGYLQRDPSRSRGVRILGVDLNPQTLSIPCYPGIPDDTTGFVSDGVEAYLAVDRRLGGAKGCYFIRARGDAYIAAGIEDGSLLLVEPMREPGIADGDLVVVRLGDAPQLARVHRSEAGYSLQPGTPGSPPHVIDDPEKLMCSGRVTAFYRRLDGAPVTASLTAH